MPHLALDLDFNYNRWNLNNAALARYGEPNGYTTIWSFSSCRASTGHPCHALCDGWSRHPLSEPHAVFASTANFRGLSVPIFVLIHGTVRLRPAINAKVARRKIRKGYNHYGVTFIVATLLVTLPIDAVI